MKLGATGSRALRAAGRTWSPSLEILQPGWHAFWLWHQESLWAGTAVPMLTLWAPRGCSPKPPPAATCSQQCHPAILSTSLGKQVAQAGTHPLRWPRGSHCQPCSCPGCQWKSTQGCRRAASLSGSRLPRHRIHATSQELFFHAWLPRELLKGRLVWPCLLSGHRPQPTRLPPHTAPIRCPPRDGRTRVRMRCPGLPPAPVASASPGPVSA